MTCGREEFILNKMGKKPVECPCNLPWAFSNEGVHWLLLVAWLGLLTIAGLSFADEVKKKNVYTRSEDKKKAEELAQPEKPADLQLSSNKLEPTEIIASSTAYSQKKKTAKIAFRTALIPGIKPFLFRLFLKVSG